MTALALLVSAGLLAAAGVVASDAATAPVTDLSGQPWVAVTVEMFTVAICPRST